RCTRPPRCDHARDRGAVRRGGVGCAPALRRGAVHLRAARAHSGMTFGGGAGGESTQPETKRSLSYLPALAASRSVPLSVTVEPSLLTVQLASWLRLRATS